MQSLNRIRGIILFLVLSAGAVGVPEKTVRRGVRQNFGIKMAGDVDRSTLEYLAGEKHFSVII